MERERQCTVQARVTKGKEATHFVLHGHIRTREQELFENLDMLVEGSMM